MKTAVMTLSIVLLASPSLAEVKVYSEIIVHKGYAFSWPKDPKDKSENASIVVYDVVEAFDKRRSIVANCDRWQTKLKGATWCFASETNLNRFNAKTDKEDMSNPYVPFLGGRCALGTSWGYPAAKGDPTTARVYETSLGKLLVLQSNKKWIPEYNSSPDTNGKIAKAAYNIGKAAGVIVPNDKMPPEQPERK